MVLPEILSNTNIDPSFVDLIFQLRFICKFAFSKFVLEHQLDMIDDKIKSFVADVEKVVLKHKKLDLKLTSIILHETTHFVHLTRLFGPLQRFNCFSNERSVGMIKKSHSSTINFTKTLGNQQVVLYGVFQILYFLKIDLGLDMVDQTGFNSIQLKTSSAFQESCLKFQREHHNITTHESYKTEHLKLVNDLIDTDESLIARHDGNVQLRGSKRSLVGIGERHENNILDFLPASIMADIRRNLRDDASVIIEDFSVCKMVLIEFKRYHYETFLNEVETLKPTTIPLTELKDSSIRSWYSDNKYLDSASSCLLTSFTLQEVKKTFKEGDFDRFDDDGSDVNFGGVHEKPIFLGLGNCHRLFKLEVYKDDSDTAQLLKTIDFGIFTVYPLRYTTDGHMNLDHGTKGRVVAVDLSTTSIKCLVFPMLNPFENHIGGRNVTLATKETFYNWERFLEHCSQQDN